LRKREAILILQIGSLGDTVISLPCYREIARRHPAADRYLLTNYPIGAKMVPAEAILRPTGMIIGSIEYPMPLRDIGRVIALRRQIRALKPSVLYYLLPEVGTANLLRHYAFFKLCGIPAISGMPWRRDLRYPRPVQPDRLWESEASRLLRTISAPAGPPSDADRDLMLTQAECVRADVVLRSLRGQPFIAVSVGGKVPLNDWGILNWTTVLRSLSQSRPGLGAVFVGSSDEHARNSALAAVWEGPSLNTCGILMPRETAAVIARAAAFVGHDTGTLHLAAAVNTPVIGIYSARNRAGKWFSDRPRDRFFYNPVACAGCEYVEIASCPHQRRCMTAHDPDAIVAAVQHALPVADEFVALQ
jgi:heptosyltransferase III